FFSGSLSPSHPWSLPFGCSFFRSGLPNEQGIAFYVTAERSGKRGSWREESKDLHTGVKTGQGLSSLEGDLEVRPEEPQQRYHGDHLATEREHGYSLGLPAGRRARVWGPSLGTEGNTWKRGGRCPVLR
ncbi:hypothetical protein EGW08_015675, partial [Elysia chlorotica]